MVRLICLLVTLVLLLGSNTSFAIESSGKSYSSNCSSGYNACPSDGYCKSAFSRGFAVAPKLSNLETSPCLFLRATS